MKGLTIGILALVWCSLSVHARDIAQNADGSLLLTANHDAQSFSRIDTASLSHAGDIALGMRPENIMLDDGGRAWVTFRMDDRVGVYDSATGDPEAIIDCGDEPFDLLQVSSSLVAVSLYRASRVVFINTATFAIDDSLATLPHPRGLALSADGQKLYVTHFMSGTVSIVDLATRQVDNAIRPEADGNLFQNLAVSADGSRLYLPLTRSNTSNRGLLFDTTVFPVVSAIDPVNEIALPGERLSLDIVDEPVGIPIDAALTGDHIFVLNAGSNDLSIINRGTHANDAHLELGHNPRSMLLAPDGARLFVHNSLSASVSVVDTTGLTVTADIPVAANPLPPGILNGKRLFNSSDRTDLSRDQWISCATCHFDGEMDGRTWFFPDGPRNTSSLLGSNATAPYHWSGDLDELHDVEATVRNIQAGSGLAAGPDNCDPACDQGPPNAGRSRDLDDLAAYMASLRLTANPNLNAGGYFDEASIRGSDLFHSEETGCASCHIPPFYTDHLRHDVGTVGPSGERKGPEFDTPSLRGIYATAPYLHDGSAENIEDVLTTHNATNQHGVTSTLSGDEISDLVAFLTSLTFEAPIFKSGFE